MNKSITPLPPADFTPDRGDYKQLQPFRYWCQKVLPLVYDDSLSYYELLCKVVDYLNKTMEDVDVLEGDVTGLHGAYVKLQSWTNEYFSSLDVQEEINNKLDNLVNDGTLSHLLGVIVGNDSFPTFVGSTDDMTNTRKVYVLSTNGHIYYYNKSMWADSGLIYGAFNSYMPSNILILNSTIDEHFNDLNDAPVNKTIFLYKIANTRMKNLPVSEATGSVSTFQYSNSDRQPGGYQLFVGANEVYIRANRGERDNYNWGTWLKLNNEHISPSYQPSNLLLLDSNIDTNFNDLNNAPVNKTIFLYKIANTRMKNLPVSEATGSVSTFQYSDITNQPGGYQLFVGNDEVYIRANTGQRGNYSWGAWLKLNNEHIKNNENKCYPNGFNLFRKFCIVGDSLSVGYHNLKNGDVVSEDKNVSWGSYIKNKYNNDVYWAGKSGATCLSWLNETSNEWGINYAKKIGAMPLYVLCMGANEVGQTIGTESDIGTDNSSLYGYVSKVIKELRKISPDCFIISTGVSRGAGKTQSIINVNTVYKTMEKHFERYFYMDCINEFNSSPFTELYNNYHYTSIGYNAMAELYSKKLNDIIKENLTEFLYA